MCKNFVCFTGNGEYNSMRSQGYSRPLSVLKIRSNVRSKYARMSKQRMLAMLTPKCKISILYQSGIHYYMHVQYMYTIVTTKGQTVGMVQNPEGVLVKISQWCAQGIEWSDVIVRLRPQTVPSGYAFSSWKPSMPF